MNVKVYLPIILIVSTVIWCTDISFTNGKPMNGITEAAWTSDTNEGITILHFAEKIYLEHKHWKLAK